MQYSIGIATEQSVRYIELTDAKIWISKNASLCRVLANRVTIFIACATKDCTHDSLVQRPIEVVFVQKPVAYKGLDVDNYVICNYMMYTTEVIQRNLSTFSA